MSYETIPGTYPVFIENNNQPHGLPDRYLVGHIQDIKARHLFDRCYNHFGWGICYGEMELEKRGEFTINADEISEAIHYAVHVAKFIKEIAAEPSFECSFSLDFTIQGCPGRKGETLECSDFRDAIERRMAELDKAGNLEWLDAVKCNESKRDFRDIVVCLNKELMAVME